MQYLPRLRKVISSRYLVSQRRICSNSLIRICSRSFSILALLSWSIVVSGYTAFGWCRTRVGFVREVKKTCGIDVWSDTATESAAPLYGSVRVNPSYVRVHNPVMSN